MPLLALGWGVKRIARELGCAKNIVKKYVSQGARRKPEAPVRVGVLDALQPWLAAYFRQHHGTGDVVRQALQRDHGLTVSLRTVERAVAPLRQALRTDVRATVRFETRPGEQHTLMRPTRSLDASVAATNAAASCSPPNAP